MTDPTPPATGRVVGRNPEDGIGADTQRLVARTLAHADDLIAGARRLMPDLAHLAFHLATLALEEVGRATLLVMVDAAGADATDGLASAQEDHVRKLFWAIWGPSFGRTMLSRAQIEADRAFAREIHATRIAGLYVDPAGPPPGEAVTVEQAQRLIAMATARIGMERAHQFGPLDDARAADVRWFVDRTRVPEHGREIFGAVSMGKLVELGNVPAWVAWLRGEAETQQREMSELAQRELARSLPDGADATEPKWRFTVRLVSASHAIRGRALAAWNARVPWITLAPAGKDHRELIATVTLPKRVSVQALYGVGLAIATDFVLALNIASGGVFWWYLPKPTHTSRFYEEMTDLDSRAGVVVERAPALHVNWGNNVLSEAELSRVSLCLGALRRATDEQRAAIEHYRVGTALIAKTDIFLEFAPNAFEEFYLAARLALTAYGDWDGTGTVVEALRPVVTRSAALTGQGGEFFDRVRAIEAGGLAAVLVDLSHVALMKLVADAVFLRAFGRVVRPTPARAASPAAEPEDRVATND